MLVLIVHRRLMMKCTYSGDIIDAFKEIYTVWCEHGEPAGLTEWNRSGYTSFPTAYDSSAIYHDCKTGHYLDTHHPWLQYTKGPNDKLVIYGVFDRVKKGGFFTRFDRNFDEDVLISYGNKYDLQIEIISGERGTPCDVVVFRGPNEKFVKAGWKDDYVKAETERQRKKLEQEEKIRIKREINWEKITPRIDRLWDSIEKAFKSTSIDTILLEANRQVRWYWEYSFEGIIPKHLKVFITSKGIHLRDHGEFFIEFEKLGYKNLETEDEILTFTMAIFCKLHELNPNNVDVKRLIWEKDFEYKDGTISLQCPYYIEPEKVDPPLKNLF